MPRADLPSTKGLRKLLLLIEIWNTDEYEKIYNTYDHTQGIYDLMDKVKGNEQ